MKQLLLFFALMSLSNFAMNGLEKGRPAFVCEQDSNGDVWINDGHGGRVKETYNSFFCCLDATRNADDVKKHFSIPLPLFMQLVVQASKTKQPDTIPFHELLCRIRHSSILTGQSVIALTHKDAEHRLLSYIPAGKVNQLVNGKKIRMTIIAGSRLVDKPTRTVIPKVEDFPLDPADLLFPEYGQGYSTRGKDIELTGQDLLDSNYDFLSDPVHHEKVVAEFRALIKG